MNLKGTKYTTINNQSVMVVDQHENIAILNNGDRVGVDQLVNGIGYTPIKSDSLIVENRSSQPVYNDDVIDPVAFFHSGNRATAQILLQNVQSINTQNLDPNAPVQNVGYRQLESTREYASDGSMINNNQNQAQPVPQQQQQLPQFPAVVKTDVGLDISKFDDEYDPETYPTEVHNHNVAPVNAAPQYQQLEIQTRDTVNNTVKDSAVLTIFKKAKRKSKINIPVNIKDKIPPTDFIKIMESGFAEDSIIDYLAADILNNFLKDKNSLLDEIKHHIKVKVYGENYKELEDEEDDEDDVQLPITPVETKKENQERITQLINNSTIDQLLQSEEEVEEVKVEVKMIEPDPDEEEDEYNKILTEHIEPIVEEVPKVEIKMIEPDPNEE